MRHAQINQARFFASGNDFDGMTQRFFGLADKGIGILGDAQRRGADAADGLGRQAAQAFAKALQTGQCARLGGFIEFFVVAEATRQTHGFLQRIERIKLIARHPHHFQTKGVGAHVDGGEGVIGGHATAPKKR